MKRSPLVRKTPLRAGKLKAKSTTRRVMDKPDPRWRSRSYLSWVKSLPCVLCGAPSDDAHHIKGVGNLSGAGLTSPDWAAMPACREHHDEIHRDPGLWVYQWEWVARTLGRAIEEGVLPGKKTPASV